MAKTGNTAENHPDRILKLDPKIGLPLDIEGSILPCDADGIAIVGSRKPSLYGIKLAGKAAEAAVKGGKTVISGLARGIDTESHRAALKFGGRTIAVLGTGINVIYPEENVGLAEEIRQNGALISQFPPDTPPIGRNFPIRNETVAKMCGSLVLVQAAAKSGSLITARLALEYGKKVFVCPGEIGDPLFEGSYGFLKKYRKNRNLKILSDFDMLSENGGYSDLNSELFSAGRSEKHPEISGGKPFLKEKKELQLDGTEKIVYNIIKSNPSGIDFDTLTVLSGIGAAELPTVLLTLILEGAVSELSGKIYKPSEAAL
ncbi:DNA-protecting protein DprA [bacterium]|nr:DNA-protecting protein DprA [bacterium]